MLPSSNSSSSTRWSSRVAFILAATGSAVGLGNVWKFPYVAGEHGGGAFVLLYLLCVLLVGLPIFAAEILLGRRGRRSPVGTMRRLVEECGVFPRWRQVGWLGMATGFVILSYYSVIAGWIVAYVTYAARGFFDGAAPSDIAALFGELTADAGAMILWHTIFMALTYEVIARGVGGGIERLVKYFVPLLIGLLIALAVVLAFEGGLLGGLRYLFKPDFSQLTGASVLAAMGQAFFSLGIGAGAIMMYGAYLSSAASIAKTSAVVALMDTGVALLAGVVVFGLVSLFALDPAQGPGLVFKTLPLAFTQMTGASYLAVMFFVLLLLAAWTSSISILEPSVVWLTEDFSMSRRAAASVMALIGWALGLLTIFSFSDPQTMSIFGYSPFELLDFTAANVMLPMLGMLVVVFAAWKLPAARTPEIWGLRSPVVWRLWFYLTHYLCPVAAAAILLHGFWPD